MKRACCRNLLGVLRVVGCLACVAPTDASADVYRCTEGGKTIYSDKPCEGDRVKIPLSGAPPR